MEMAINTDTHISIFFIITVVGLVIVFTVYPLWIALHNVLCKRLDPILFREPYFQKAELVNYLCWPLSYLRSFNYVFLIASPTFAKRKRFRGFDGEIPVRGMLVVLCKLHFSLMILLSAFFFIFFGYGGAIIYFDL